MIQTQKPQAGLTHTDTYTCMCTCLYVFRFERSSCCLISIVVWSLAHRFAERMSFIYLYGNSSCSVHSAHTQLQIFPTRKLRQTYICMSSSLRNIKFVIHIEYNLYMFVNTLHYSSHIFVDLWAFVCWANWCAVAVVDCSWPSVTPPGSSVEQISNTNSDAIAHTQASSSPWLASVLILMYLVYFLYTIHLSRHQLPCIYLELFKLPQLI